MRFFRKKIFIFTPKISDDLFFVIDHVFQIFPILSRFSISLLREILCMTLSSPEKTPIPEINSLMNTFFTLFVLSRASDNTTSQNIGGRMHGPSPTSNFLGDRPPIPPRSPPMSVIFLEIPPAHPANSAGSRQPSRPDGKAIDPRPNRSWAGVPVSNYPPFRLPPPPLPPPPPALSPPAGHPHSHSLLGGGG